MYRRWRVLTVGLGCSAIALLWGPLFLAGAADDLYPLSKQLPQLTYREPAAPKYRPTRQPQTFREAVVQPAPRPSGKTQQGTTTDIRQKENVAYPSNPIPPTVVPSKVEPPTVVGRVLFRGKVPPPAQIPITQDANFCGQFATLQSISADPATGGLRDAIVHVNVGASDLTADAYNNGRMEVLPIRNSNCLFTPRVGVERTESSAEIVNDDPLLHNLNMTIGNRTVINVALVSGGRPIRKQFKKAGLHVVKCNVHDFMYGYRHVFDDPFFAKTTDEGEFRISNLPPGTHKITAWHETLGVLEKDVQVPVQGTAHIDFEFK
jgi:hypothetical protein